MCLLEYCRYQLRWKRSTSSWEKGVPGGARGAPGVHGRVLTFDLGADYTSGFTFWKYVELG